MITIRRKEEDVARGRALRKEQQIKASCYSVALETASSLRYEMKRKGMVTL